MGSAPRTFAFHHVGVVTSDLEEARAVYEQLGYAASPVYRDPLQLASIVLLRRVGDPMVEIIAPSSVESPAAGWLKRIRAGAYHTCYEVGALDESIERLRQLKFVPVSDPVPAVAFGGRPVAFLWSSATGLLELLGP